MSDMTECPCDELKRLRKSLTKERECYEHTWSKYAAQNIAKLNERIAELEMLFDRNPNCCDCERCRSRGGVKA